MCPTKSRELKQDFNYRRLIFINFKAKKYTYKTKAHCVSHNISQTLLIKSYNNKVTPNKTHAEDIIYDWFLQRCKISNEKKDKTKPEKKVAHESFIRNFKTQSMQFD